MTEQAEDARDILFLGCIPVNLDEVESKAAEQEGISLLPYDGSLQIDCTKCGRAIWIGPRQQQVVNAPETAVQYREIQKLCFRCVALVAMETPELMHGIADLGNTRGA